MKKRSSGPMGTIRELTLPIAMFAVLGLLGIPGGSFAADEEICFSTQRHMVGGAPDSLDSQAADIARLYRLENGLAGANAPNLTGQGNVAVFILSRNGEPVTIFSGRSGSQNSLAHQMGLHVDVRLDSVSNWEKPGFKQPSRIGEQTMNIFRSFKIFLLLSFGTSPRVSEHKI